MVLSHCSYVRDRSDSIGSHSTSASQSTDESDSCLNWSVTCCIWSWIFHEVHIYLALIIFMIYMYIIY